MARRETRGNLGPGGGKLGGRLFGEVFDPAIVGGNSPSAENRNTHSQKGADRFLILRRLSVGPLPFHNLLVNSQSQLRGGSPVELFGLGKTFRAQGRAIFRVIQDMCEG